MIDFVVIGDGGGDCGGRLQFVPELDQAGFFFLFDHPKGLIIQLFFLFVGQCLSFIPEVFVMNFQVFFIDVFEGDVFEADAIAFLRVGFFCFFVLPVSGLFADG